jgi:S-formylglutathione hydrolase FrmB
MNAPRRWFLRALLAIGLLSPAAMAQDNLGAPDAPDAIGSFKITIDPSVLHAPYTGRVYVTLSKHGKPEPRLRMGEWLGGSQVFSLDVKDVAPGGSVTLGPGSLAFPAAYADATAGDQFAQAVAKVNPDDPNAGRGAGDLYSEPVSLAFKPGASGVVELTLSRAVAERKFHETERVKLFEMVSPSLTAHYGRPFTLHAGVVLPEGWTDDASRHYPTLYFIGGFGGNHFSAHQMALMAGPDPDAKQILWIVPDPTCGLGHSVFADSANNGPWGKALTEELIPAIEAKFHGSGDGAHRYVCGISSGGWSSLWLQVAYPDLFAGVWSHCPDPVDFRDFQRINLYTPGVNMYRDDKGERRPLARRTINGEDAVTLWYDDFVRQETVMGPGGQIHSFEAVFSPKGEDGKPRPLFDRTTGAIDHATAEAWEKYDIHLVLENHWAELGPKLKGKLHIYAGAQDNFYLDGAVKLLRTAFMNLGCDAKVAVVPEMGHSIHQPGMEEMYKSIVAASRPAAQGTP